MTGAEGLLGANLVLDFVRRGWRVLALDRRATWKRAEVDALSCDLCEFEAVSEILALAQPRAIIHCAAATNVDWCEEHPAETERNNVAVSGNLASAAARTGAQFVYISTDSVFDGQRGHYAERDHPRPVNVYARSKLAGELAVLEAYGGSLVVRTNIYGWNRQPKQSLAEWILGRLEAGLEVPCFCDVVFSPLLVNDLGDYIWALLQQGATGVFHVAAGDQCSKYAFALMLAEVFDLDSALLRRSSLSESALRAPRPRNTSLDTQNARTALGRELANVRSGLVRFRTLRRNRFVDELRTA